MTTKLALIALLVAGCSSSPTGSGTLQVSGAVSGWTRGAGYQLVAAVNNFGHYTELGATAIAADGTFALSTSNLGPALAQRQPFLVFFAPTEGNITCTSSPKLTPADLEVALIELVVKDPAGQYTETRTLSQDGTQYVVSSVAATVSGAEQCGSSGVELDFDVALEPGFNAVVESGPNTKVSIKSTGAVSPVVLSAFF